MSAYKDHLGYYTIGYGRLIDKRRGGGISHDEALYLLGNDIAKCTKQVESRLPWFDKLVDARKAVLLNMSFQMGVAGLMKFKNTLALIEDAEYGAAADSMLKSKWAQQTPNRARELAEQMRTGKWIF